MQCVAQLSPLEHGTAQEDGLCDVVRWPGLLHRFSTGTEKTDFGASRSRSRSGPTTAGMALGSVPQGGCYNFGSHSSLLTDHEADAKTCMYVHKGKAPRLLAGRVTTITHRIINGVNSDKLISHFIH